MAVSLILSSRLIGQVPFSDGSSGSVVRGGSTRREYANAATPIETLSLVMICCDWIGFATVRNVTFCAVDQRDHEADPRFPGLPEPEDDSRLVLTHKATPRFGPNGLSLICEGPPPARVGCVVLSSARDRAVLRCADGLGSQPSRSFVRCVGRFRARPEGLSGWGTA